MLDLKQPAAVELALELCDWADVIVENFSRGTLERLGIDVDALLERRPELIFCSVSTFGTYGPHADKPGFGYVAESYSGLMWLNGDGDEPPSFFGTPLADCNVGVHAFARDRRGALPARADRARHAAGPVVLRRAGDDDRRRGRAAHVHAAASASFGRFGTRHTLVVPASIIGTKDGEYVTYGAPGDRAFARVAAAMGRPEWMDTPHFGSPEGRVANQDELYDADRGLGRRVRDRRVADRALRRARRAGRARAHGRRVRRRPGAGRARDARSRCRSRAAATCSCRPRRIP